MSDVKKSSESTAASVPSAPGWSEEGLAALLLRLMGVYFVAWGLITATDPLVRLVLAAREFGLDSALSNHWFGLIYPVVELVVGVYFLIGGRWVFEKLLTPIVRHPTDESSADVHEGTPKDAPGPR
jgi:hypothetical protein